MVLEVLVADQREGQTADDALQVALDHLEVLAFELCLEAVAPLLHSLDQRAFLHRDFELL